MIFVFATNPNTSDETLYECIYCHSNLFFDQRFILDLFTLTFELKHPWNFDVNVVYAQHLQTESALVAESDRASLDAKNYTSFGLGLYTKLIGMRRK